MKRCKICSKLLTFPYYGNGTYCSRSCHNKWIARNRSDRSKSIDIFDNLSIFRTLKESPDLSWRDLGINYSTSVQIIVRSNPLRLFNYSGFPIEYKRSLVRRYINNKDMLGSLKRVSLLCNKSYGTFTKFLEFCIEEFPHIEKFIIDLYKRYNTWEIADLLLSNQRSISRLLNNLGITSRSMRCSKIHLNMKPIIEKLLGRPTITEHYISPYWIDEFDPIDKICIEIDGEWCHNSEYDKRLKLGTIRLYCS